MALNLTLLKKRKIKILKYFFANISRRRGGNIINTKFNFKKITTKFVAATEI